MLHTSKSYVLSTDDQKLRPKHVKASNNIVQQDGIQYYTCNIFAKEI